MNTTPRRLGKYELQEPLGRGGMAEVWKALDTQLRRPVAIKLLHANLQDDPNFVTRFMHEAQVIAALRHPNIVQIYDFHISESNSTGTSDVDAIAYMVMEYIRGQTLATYITNTSYKKDIPSADTIIRLFTPISSALDYAHQQGTIHRDIKPANILLDQRNTLRNVMGEPILSDFGLAKLLNAESQTMTGTVFGTPLYISPEQVQGKTVSSRSDLYSLGVILYEIFTGERPFQGDNVTAIMLKQISEMPPAPHLVNPNLPPTLSSVILKSIAKNPQERYASASAMIAAVARAFNMPVPVELQQTNVQSEQDDISQTIRASLSAQSTFAPANKPAAPNPVTPIVSTEPVENGTHAAGSHSVESYKTELTPVVQAENKYNPTSSAGIIPAFNDSLLSAETIASPEVGSPIGRQNGVREPQRNLATDTPLPAAPVVPQGPIPSPTPPSTGRRRRPLLIAALIVLICLVIGSALAAFLIYNNATANASVGSASFVSSGKVNETTNQGANDEFQIDLHSIAAPSAGKSYYGWLLPDKTQAEGNPVLLGRLAVNNGSINFLYTGDGQHTNLLTTSSRFLITEEDASVMPDIPTPDMSMWRYYAEIPQAIAPGQTYSLLDHLRHLLADDPDLQKLHIPGGLAIWTYRDTQKLAYYGQTAMAALKAQDYNTVHKRVVETLDFIDGATMVTQDVPPGTPLMADPLPSQVPLLQFSTNQQPPGYFYHDALHLEGVVQSPGSTQSQQKMAQQINLLLGEARVRVEQVRQDAIKLAAMSNVQLSSSQALLQDMFVQANYAFSGTPNYVATMQGANGGISFVYEDIQRLATFDVKPYK